MCLGTGDPGELFPCFRGFFSWLIEAQWSLSLKELKAPGNADFCHPWRVGKVGLCFGKVLLAVVLSWGIWEQSLASGGGSCHGCHLEFPLLSRCDIPGCCGTSLLGGEQGFPQEAQMSKGSFGVSSAAGSGLSEIPSSLSTTGAMQRAQEGMFHVASTTVLSFFQRASVYILHLLQQCSIFVEPSLLQDLVCDCSFLSFQLSLPFVFLTMIPSAVWRSLKKVLMW